MRTFRILFLSFVLFCAPQPAGAQSSVRYNNQQLFLNGANLAWMSFGNDIGPGTRDYTSFGSILLQLHNRGGNVLRWWLHANGAVTPEFNDTGLVVSPGPGTIASLRNALDIAWQREISVILCLWSFDMLRGTNTNAVLARNLKLLTDTSSIRAYINNCLLPIVDSLKGHPAIAAWEIFNEPEGMSNEYYFYQADPHVPMSFIQRFVNLCAGAIHRRDSTILVTNGAWSFKSLTDVPLGSLSKSAVTSTGSVDVQQMAQSFNATHRYPMSVAEFGEYLRRIALSDNYNFYSNSRLIAEGGDPKGTLDFYSVHYYDWGGTQISPLHHPSGTWQLDKPVVVAEFALKDTYGVTKGDIYKTIFRNGYAGALAWSWTDVSFSQPPDILAGTRSIWDMNRGAVDIHGVGSDWAEVNITSPSSDSVFAAGSAVAISATASVIDNGSVVSVDFYANDTLKIGTSGTAPYSVVWQHPPSGYHALTAVATGNLGHRSSSDNVRIQVGTASIVKLEAEGGAKAGDVSNMFVRSLPTASGGAYLELRTQSGTISWTIPSIPAAGLYDISFAYRLSFDTPKSQYLNINGVRAATVTFDGPMNVWLEKNVRVALVAGSNVIQLDLAWGWMDLDYLTVPRNPTSIVLSESTSLPDRLLLDQNYPNPFNPVTTITFTLPSAGLERSQQEMAKLEIFDLMGRTISVLVNERLGAGIHTVRWDASQSPSGVYFYRLTAAGEQRMRKMILIR
ncbi:MAG TPA: Ig-like domain-containing protein [Bacteroidota bacterium]|nr:Ig-like domain-containing protein [Bacteroidota bacterium]